MASTLLSHLESGYSTETPKKLFLSTSPPSEEEGRALAVGLTLAEEPLQAPSFVKTGWQNGQTFTEEDDPDRVREYWAPPSFITSKDPCVQRQKTRVEELHIPMKFLSADSFARVVHDVLDETDCKELIACINEKGFTPALLNIGRGRQKLEPYVRNGHRAIVDSPALAEWLLEVLRPHLPEKAFGSTLVDLNERCRILCYTPGQEFASHFDGNYRRPPGSDRAGDNSRVTVQVYLHDLPEENGGATTFMFGSIWANCFWAVGKDQLPCQPRRGSVLLFTQDLEHEGSMLKHGLKYTLRTEAMYRLAKGSTR